MDRIKSWRVKEKKEGKMCLQPFRYRDIFNRFEGVQPKKQQ